MEILHRGLRPSERTYRGRCVTCKTEVRFKQHEAKSSSDPREPGYYVDCPVCNNWIWGRLEG